ncbi:uncharacterized protein Osi15 [Eurosta solidaginis]|uniref:uncharacterized protein Osi15 n=1 Tax=Eurosta solidaginis TaxID=178769 RepID=UPI003530ED21
MCSKYLCAVLIASFACSVLALPSQQQLDESEKDVIGLINRIDSADTLPLFGGLRVERTETGRQFGGSVMAVESVEDRVERYLATHELNIGLNGDDEEADSEYAGRAMEESRSKKMKKMLLPLLLILKLKKAVLCKLAFSIIKFISLKSLAISILALILAGATFFKDLLGKKKEHITTAYITGSPLNAEIVHSDWNRNGQATASDLAYNQYGLAQPYHSVNVMLLQRNMEYLYYLGFFILILKMSNAATVREEITSENSINAPPASSHATSTETTNTPNSKYDGMKRAFEECHTQFSWMCLKIEFVKIMERLTEKDELVFAPGISIVKDVSAAEVKSNDLMAEVARSYANDPNSRINGYIVNKLSSFLQSHYLRFKLIDQSTIAEARSAVETGRKGKFGKKGGMEALLAAGLVMKGTLMALAMGALALLAGKALLTALMALTLSSIVGLKGLASGGGKSTYEIVAKPVYSSSHSHDEHGGGGHGHMSSGHGGSGYGGFGRSIDLLKPINVQ